jgi:acetolactate synthase small subunit
MKLRKINNKNIVAHIEGIKPFYCDVISIELESGIVYVDTSEGKKDFFIDRVELFEIMDGKKGSELVG